MRRLAADRILTDGRFPAAGALQQLRHFSVQLVTYPFQPFALGRREFPLDTLVAQQLLRWAGGAGGRVFHHGVPRGVPVEHHHGHECFAILLKAPDIADSVFSDHPD